MTREYLFLVMLLFTRVCVANYVGGGDIPPGLGYYSPLTNVSASGSRVRGNDRVVRSSYEKMADGARRHIDGAVKGGAVGGPKGHRKSHYQSIIDEAAQRRWAFPIALSYSLENRAFNCDGCKVPLSESLFGDGTRIRDIFLIARLSDDDKLRLGGTGTRKFGHIRAQQYLALLAPVKLNMTAGSHGADLNFGGMYRFRPFSGRNLFGIIGFNLPVVAQVRTIDLGLHDGVLFGTGYTDDETKRETTLTQFFKDFSSVEDFFIRAVLGSKGITFDLSQRKVGLGDISLFANLEFGPFMREYENGFCAGLDAGQIGVNVSFPTASKLTGNNLWEIQLGNGSYQFTFFGNAIFRTKSNFFNPALHAGVEINTCFCAADAGLRIPRVVKHEGGDTKIGDIPDIYTPVFKEYRADAFEEVDSTVAMFADKIAEGTFRRGHRIFVGLGNYFYNVFKTNFRLGAFYNYSHKGEDKLCCEESCDTSCFEGKSIAHRVSWSLAYKFENFVEVGFGSQHIVAGKNVPEQHEIFLSLSAAF